MTSITVQVSVNAPIEKVWSFWNEPEHIKQWLFASDDWECPSSENDLRVGGTFKNRMSAKDGSFGFDMEGTYTEVVPMARIAYTFGGRTAVVEFSEQDGVTTVTETFDPETENPVEMQRDGWQSILNNFKKHAESAAS